MKSDTQALFDGLSNLIAIHQSMSIGELRMLLAVALHEGACLNDLCEITGTKRSTASLNLRSLADKTRNGKQGYGLILREQAHRADWRKNRYVLTVKGREIVAGLGRPT
jgi:DNA-binding MarR family transcriptional regulator